MYGANNNTIRNGGSLLTHLPLSSLSDPEGWLRYKWLQPPPRAPNWLFAYYEAYNPPANVGRPLQNEEWHQRAFHEDQQAAGLLPPAPRGGPILHGACACTERAYKDWKWAIDNLWADEHHCQPLLNEQAARARQEAAAARARQEAAAARACQEAARRQQLLNEQEQEATRACQEAAHCQQLLDEQAPRARQEAGLLFAKRLFAWCIAEDQRSAERRAQARERAAARTIFLWLCCRRLHIRLVRQTSRRQQREAALARLRYEQDCCRRVALPEEQRRQAVAARAKAAINKATKQLRQVEDALLSARGIALAEATNERRRHEAAAYAKALAAQELAVVDDKHHRHEAAAHATALAAKVLADKRGGQESAVHAKVFVAQALAIAPSLPPRPTSYAGAVLSTLGGSLLPAVPSSPPSPTTGSPLQTVCRRVQPCRCTGRRNRPCPPSPVNKALPSHPQPTWAGTSTPILAVPTLLARAISIPCLESARASSPTCLVTPSQLLSMTASSSPSLQPFDVKNSVSVLLDVGGAHPLHDCGLPLPPQKRAHGRCHPRCVCQRHGPRAPDPPEPLACPTSEEDGLRWWNSLFFYSGALLLGFSSLKILLGDNFLG
jgi:hypothetical protein